MSMAPQLEMMGKIVHGKTIAPAVEASRPSWNKLFGLPHPSIIEALEKRPAAAKSGLIRRVSKAVEKGIHRVKVPFSRQGLGRLALRFATMGKVGSVIAEEKVSSLSFIETLEKYAAGLTELWFKPEKGGDPVNVVVEKALTPNEIRRGLMYRRHLGDNEGMLFEFPDSRRRFFYMRNTYIPLDMIFIDAERKVAGVVENAEPLSESPRGIASSSKWVVEVPAGFCAKHSIYAGARMMRSSEA
jgi:uncharacterized membrane protein (UPF0127 family)